MDDRVAILSDVHGNWEALTAVLAALDAEGIGQILHLGDIVGYGEAGARCLRLLRERGVISVQGNHDGNIRPPRDPDMRDEALKVLERECSLLDETEIEYLTTLPVRLVIEDEIILVHGALTGRDHYILNAAAVKANREILRNTFQGIRICFFGHTHLPMVIQGGTVEMDFHESRTVALDPFASYMVNPGSVGQPRDKCPKAAFAVYDRKGQTVTIRRAEYDIEAEQARMQASGLGAKLWKRIAMGV